MIYSLDTADTANKYEYREVVYKHNYDKGSCVKYTTFKKDSKGNYPLYIDVRKEEKGND